MKATIAIVGAGPAGLMAAERLSALGHAVTVFDRMAQPARKFLMAGRGGLNLTHSEPPDRFVTRYGGQAAQLAPAIAAWSPQATTAWANGLGCDTFIGSSGRIFPKAMKASPLLRAWLARLQAQGVKLELKHDWRGFDGQGRLIFATPSGGQTLMTADATLLALGGASWPRLGSNGAWTEILARDGIALTPLSPANCGILVPWSHHVADRFAGAPLKRIAITFADKVVRGEALITRTGLEGGAVYALASRIRDCVDQQGATTISLDLRPDLSRAELVSRLTLPRGKQSAPTFLRKSVALSPAAIAVVREPGPLPLEPEALAERIKSLKLSVTGCAGLDRAISTAGGVCFAALDERYMLKARPGVFVAGEMIDWDAPTGGYLLQATFATAVAAAGGINDWLAANRHAFAHEAPA